MSESKCQLPACPSTDGTQLKPSKISLKFKCSSVLSSCRICLSSIFDPASLTCGHKFCEECLDQYWHVKDKPNFLVCPLCRAHIYNVDFTEKEEIPEQKKREFRKNFTLMDTEDVPSNTSNSTLLCFKITMLIPFVYYILKWMKLPVLEMFSLLRCKLWHKM